MHACTADTPPLYEAMLITQVKRVETLSAAAEICVL